MYYEPTPAPQTRSAHDDRLPIQRDLIPFNAQDLRQVCRDGSWIWNSRKGDVIWCVCPIFVAVEHDRSRVTVSVAIGDAFVDTVLSVDESLGHVRCDVVNGTLLEVM